MTLQFNARRYDTGEPVRISIAGERIVTVEPAWPGGAVADWPYVAPGLFDLQVNGHGGVWFSSRELTTAEAATAIRAYFAHGVTRLCPTLITNSFEALTQGFYALRKACEQDPVINRMVPGFHLEGPYFSSEDGPRGAHPREHIRPANWNEFCKWQEVAGGRIRLVTIAPEVPGAVEFIREAAKAGVRCALGHTAANSDQICAAVDAGAVLSTHLGNGAHGQLRRHPNYIWDQLGEPRLFASLITDGHHLPPAVVRSMIRGKSPRQIVITCDASGWAGCPPGTYQNELGTVEVLANGRIGVAGQSQMLAGSGAGTMECVSKAIEFAGLSFREAFDMAASQPARLLGFDDYGLRRRSRADLVLFNDERATGKSLKVVATVAAGVVQYGTVG